MLRAFANALRIPDLRGKILFTLAIVIVYRIGAHIPTPGVDVDALRATVEGGLAGAANLINLFSGGAFTQLSVFALGIMPYITASIMLQLLTVVIPKLDEWKKEGETGQQKITQLTRYVTVGLALLQSTGLLVAVDQIFGEGTAAQVITDDSIALRALMVLTLTSGTALIMYLGELISQRGVGNGMSLIIFAAIVAELPSQTRTIFVEQTTPFFVAMLIVALLILVAVVFIEQGQRRIPVQYAKRQVGKRLYGGTSTYIPLKLNQSGVIPIIFASALMYLPTLAASIIARPGFQRIVDEYFALGDHPAYMITFFLLTVFFAYFYTAITFNPVDVADNMKKYGGFIPGIRPGRPTAEYLDKVLTRITFPGSLYLATLAVLPLIVLAGAGVPFPFGGAVILIVVGVALNTMKQIEGQLMQRDYEGFLRS